LAQANLTQNDVLQFHPFTGGWEVEVPGGCSQGLGLLFSVINHIMTLQNMGMYQLRVKMNSHLKINKCIPKYIHIYTKF
jgi:hypothetical protein